MRRHSQGVSSRWRQTSPLWSEWQGQGVVSVFRFGAAYGAAIGVISALAIPLHLVSPARWKRHYGLDADKERSRARAIQFWPASRHFTRKKDHGRAEAALLARYGAEVVLSKSPLALPQDDGGAA